MIVNYIRKKFQWMITPEDENPEIDKEGYKRFVKHGYDSELGWVRKPNTEHDEFGKDGKTAYHIDSEGIRVNPNHEKLPQLISCYGDSFCFCRQVNDDQTWEWFLSKFTKSNVLNFGVGNFGIDQALLRLKREYTKNKTKIVIMCVVPSTIVRIMCVWKHYNEYGNVFGFKPRFEIDNGKLKLVKNIIDTERKIFELEKYLPEIKKHDHFYKTKFKKEMIEHPYFLHFLKNPRRNFTLEGLVFAGRREQAMMKIMEINLKLRLKLYKEKYPVTLFKMIVKEFADYAKKNGFKPVFMMLPQKDDVLYIQKKGHYYHDLLESSKKWVHVIDINDYLINRTDLDRIYSDDNKYGGHPSKYGNEYIAGILADQLKELLSQVKNKK